MGVFASSQAWGSIIASKKRTNLSRKVPFRNPLFKLDRVSFSTPENHRNIFFEGLSPEFSGDFVMCFSSSPGF